MTFPENLGTITCRCVADGIKPVLAVSHAGGDWQMYCAFDDHDFEDRDAMARELVVIHIAHLVRRDGSLEAVADLPIDMGAERTAVGAEWTRFRDADDD